MKFRNLRTHPRRRVRAPGAPLTIDFSMRMKEPTGLTMGKVVMYSIGFCPEGFVPVRVYRDGRLAWERTAA